MAQLKTAKNLLQKRDEYSRYYGDFRGVDFSSDHTQVHDQRLAYSVNMFKDYQSGQGKAIETVPGYRQRAKFDGGVLNGIHKFGNELFVHCGTNLYLWDIEKHPNVNVAGFTKVALQKGIEIDGKTAFEIFGFSKFDGVYNDRDEEIESFIGENGQIVIVSEALKEGDTVFVKGGYKPILLAAKLNDGRSRSFIVGKDGYIIDGSRLSRKKSNTDTLEEVNHNVATIPTTYIGLTTKDTVEDIENNRKKNQQNFLQPKFKTTFVADGETKTFYLLNEFQSIEEVKVYNTTVKNTAETTYYEWDAISGTITFADGHIPQKPDDVEQSAGIKYPIGYAGIEITARMDYKESAKIERCTLFALFDDRVFLSGNPECPNTVFWCSRNPDTGRADPTYWGMLDHVQCGQEGNAPITGLIPVANTLVALTGDSKGEGSIYYITPEETQDKYYPIKYTVQSGLNGIGCLGACVNFLDDPVFVSRLGLEGVGQLSTRLERAIEHRSSLVDAKLCNEDLSKATLTEWNGYLIVLVEGRMYLADSRQRFTHDTGVMQYEWYYLEDIGIYDNMKEEHKYSSYGLSDEGLEVEIDGKSVKLYIDTEREGLVVPSSYNVVEVTVNEQTYYAVRDGEDRAYLVEPTGGMTTTEESTFHPAVAIESVDGNLYFGTDNGVICSFNFDMRGDDGSIDPKWYTFDGRTILCGVATKMDNCGIPHLVKNTVKKSTVIKTKTYQTSAAKIKVRTNNKPYEQIARINSTVFSFENMDFSDFSFLTTEQSLFSIREKEKRWVEKQYYIYSDEIGKPFALFYIAFRYNVAGRYKE